MIRILAALLILAGAAQAADRYRAYIDGPWGQIHVRVAGKASDPTVVILHQMTWSSEQYAHALPELASRGVRAIAVDIPGYGESDGPSDPSSAAQYADALLPVLDHFTLKRAILLGTNTGATFVTVFADRHPERVKHLILEGVPIWDAPTREKLIAGEPHGEIKYTDDGSFLANRWVGSRTMAKGRLSEAASLENIIKTFNAGPRGWYAHEAVFRTDLEPIVKRVKAPITALTYPGQELYETSRNVANVRADAKVVELSNVGRSMAPAFDNPKEWAEAVARIVSAK